VQKPLHAAIDAFWQTVSSQRADLEALESADEPAYDACLEALHAVDEGLYLEFSLDGTPYELIVTAEGDKELFPLVGEVVARAVTLPGWKVMALKPKLGFPETAIWEDYELEIAQVSFEPLASSEGAVGLRFFVPGLGEEDAENAHNALLRACDHGLGERAFAEGVEFTECVALPEGKAPSDFILLQELESYLAWQKKKTNGGAGVN
jgi:hypothetical protein